jgi:hypothetical protein
VSKQESKNPKKGLLKQEYTKTPDENIERNNTKEEGTKSKERQERLSQSRE